MADLIRCTDCTHCPGLGQRCEINPRVRRGGDAKV